jgi:hypothetical protein
MAAIAVGAVALESYVAALVIGACAFWVLSQAIG